MPDERDSTDLDHRSGLAQELRFLLERHPREQWATRMPIGSTARMWLERHDWFRHHSRTLIAGVSEFREGHIGPAKLGSWLRPRLRLLVSHLEGHHQVEDQAYFPMFTAAEPRLARGLDMLESDHHAIHARLIEMEAASGALASALRGSDPYARMRSSDRIATALEGFLKPLDRHLADEEDIVIPLMIDRPGF